MNEPRHLDLFSGIGGFSLAAERAGFKTIAFSEIDDYASRVLRKHWPDVPNLGDITKWRDWPDLGNVSLITGGFPCQPFSVAGKRRGAKDDRFLWPAMLDVIGRYRPAWVLGENVPGIIGMELERCLSDLEGKGYRVQPLVIPACAADARHRRDRIWIVAHASSAGREEFDSPAVAATEALGSRSRHAGDVADTSSGRCNGAVGGQVQQSWGAKVIGGSEALADPGSLESGRLSGGGREEISTPRCNGEDVANAESVGSQQAANGREPGESVSVLGCADVPDAMLNERLRRQGRTGRRIGSTQYADARGAQAALHWPTEPGLGRVAHGVSDRVDRLKGLGNSIVPQVAEVILKAMYETMQQMPRD